MIPATRFAECRHPWREHVRDGLCAECATEKDQTRKEEDVRLIDPWSDEARRIAADRYLHPERYEKAEKEDDKWFLTFMIVVGMIVGYVITAIVFF